MKSSYLLLGPEKGRKKIFIEEILNKTADKIGEKPEVYTFYPFETDIREVVSLLENGSLFARAKVVILKMAEQLKGKNSINILVEYLKKPSPGSILIIESDTFKDIPAAVRGHIPKDNVKIFWEMNEGDKRGWIIHYFRKREIKIEIDAVNELLELVENNTLDLEQECEKLSIFFRDRAKITAEDIEEHLYHSREENVFTLFAKMAERDFSGTLEVLSSILFSRKSNPDQVILGILWQIERLMNYKFLLEKESHEPAEAFKKLSLTTKRSRRIYSEGSRNYTMEELADIIQLIYNTVFKLRSLGSGLHETIITMFFYYAIVKGGKGYWRLMSH